MLPSEPDHIQDNLQGYSSPVRWPWSWDLLLAVGVPYCYKLMNTVCFSLMVVYPRFLLLPPNRLSF